MIAGEKNSISTNRKSTTRFPTSHRWTVYVTPKSPNGWHKTRFCYFFQVNFNFCRIKSATEFLCVKTSSGKVVATSFLYLTVHRWLRATSPKWPTPVGKCRFRHISLNSAATMRVSEKNATNTRFPASPKWTVYVTPKSPKGLLKTKNFTFGVALHFFVAGNRRHFKLNMDDKMSLKWAWPRHVTHFKHLVPLRYLLNSLS